jgi:hypothetical protein
MIEAFVAQFTNNPQLQLTLELIVFVALKTIIRQVFSNLPFLSLELQKRLLIFSQHLVFTVLGHYVLVTYPTEHNIVSWFYDSSNNWRYPIYPFPLFLMYYKLKVATHVEDLLYMAFTWIAGIPTDEAKKGRDIKMDVHHISTAALCIGSYVSNYAKIGSLVMFLHDASDLPLDVLRLSSTLNLRWLQYISFPVTLVGWVYWRLYFLPFFVMRSIVTEARSLLFDVPCDVGECSWSKFPLESLRERVPFLLLLGSLLYLHIVWFQLLVKKGYRELVSKSKVANSKKEKKQ